MASKKYPMWCECCEKKVYVADAKCDGTDICPICGADDLWEYECQDILTADDIVDDIEKGIFHAV